jgi:hypothetical protein
VREQHRVSGAQQCASREAAMGSLKKTAPNGRREGCGNDFLGFDMARALLAQLPMFWNPPEVRSPGVAIVLS